MAQRKKTSRSVERHRALDVVFEADEKGLASEEGILALLEERRSVSTAQVPIRDFGTELVSAYATHCDNIDSLIEAASEDWSLARMNVVDRTILRLGASEMVVLGTGRALAVGEWAALARELSTDRSVGFVMGVLNKVADIREAETGKPVEKNIDKVDAVHVDEIAAPSTDEADEMSN